MSKMLYMLEEAIGMIKSYRFKSVFFKYMKRLIVFILLPCIMVMILFYIYYNTSVNQAINIALNQSLGKSTNAIEKIFEEIDKYRYQLILDLNFNLVANDDMKEINIKNSQYMTLLKDSMADFVNMSFGISDVHIYFPKGEYVFSTENSNKLTLFQGKEIFESFIETGDINSVMSYRGDLVACYSIFDDGNIQAIVAFVVKNDTLRSAVNSEENPGEDFCLFKDGHVLYSSKDINFDEKVLRKSIERKGEIVEHNNYIALATELEGQMIDLVLTNDKLTFKEQKRALGMAVIASGLFLMVTAILSLIWLSLKFYGDIMGIVAHFKPTYYNGNVDELVYINEKIIQAIDEKNYSELELNEKRQQIVSLQSAMLQMQINPHFLFNTLNLISVIVTNTVKKSNDVERVIVLLSDLLSIALDTKNYIVPVIEEIDYIQKYIEIEKIKYNDRFDVEYHIDDDVLDLKTVKLILQPIVENAFEHGIKLLKGRRGKITISAHLVGGRCIFKILDNGCGISEQKLNEIKENLNNGIMQSPDNIGLCNVHNRIRLIYGDDYGIKISSDDAGTEVVLEIPAEL